MTSQSALIVVAKGHRLAGRDHVTLPDLKGERWIIDTASSTYTRMLTEACQGAGFDPQIMARCKGFEVSVALIRSHAGISILPGLRASHDLQDVQVRPLKPEIRRKISLAYRKGQGRSPALRAFIAACRHVAKDLNRDSG
jgi:DNA-binding transcriptional LysR family regulator